MKKLIIAGVILAIGISVLFAAVIYMAVSSNPRPRRTASAAAPARQAAPEKKEPGFFESLSPAPIVTMAEYGGLKNGISYSAAVKIIGDSGSEMSRVDLAGYETVMYMWQNKDGSNMNAMFQNGGLIQKAQFGLK